MDTGGIPSRQLFIAGQWRQPSNQERISIINPATEEIIGSIPAGSESDVKDAVVAAKSAFHQDKGRHWSRTSGSYRAKFLRLIAAKVTERKAELARLETLDCGKPIDEAEWDMDDVAGCFEYYAGLAEKMDEQRVREVAVPMETFKTHVIKEPIGVVGLITPWNYPLLMAVWKVAPALAAGCTCILKPSEMASMTCLELGAIAREVGLPAGVLNIVTGLGPVVGAPLASHPDVDKVAFTGSTATGRTIMKLAAEVIKPVTMELGGKSPIIVFDDVDIDKAVEWAMFGVFWTNGQICSATSRLLIQEGIADKFLHRLTEWTQSININDPSNKGTRLGPVVSKGQYDKVMGYIQSAISEGAALLTGGKRPKAFSRGYFIEPTVLLVKPTFQIWREEVFGPVLSVVTFKTEEEAVALANDSQYGLGAAILSNDEARCKRITEEFQSGIVWVNCSQPCFCQAPWGGNKRSGFGRELGEWGLDNYLTVKQVTSYVSNDAWGWYPPPSKL